MRDILIKKATSPLAIAFGFLLIFIFITAMKQSREEFKQYTYLALGDSYTIGEQVSTKENFPNQTTALLEKDGFDFKPATIIAKTGWTTDELDKAIKQSKLQSRYDFVTLLIGVNNQYRGKKVADYIPEFEALLKQAIRFAGNDTSHVIVLSIPDWGATPFANAGDRNKITVEIDEYNAANKLIALKYHVHYIDITPGSREASNDPSLVTTDGLHPSAKEYSRWAEKVADAIKSNLK
ncbi:MAG: SGNH/GDSL hydrolase family protein [Chitinophagaceae bacterium]